MFCYAQLNQENICVVVSQLSGEVKADNMIPIPEQNLNLLGKKYIDGEFIEAEIPEVEPAEQELTENEIIMLAMAEIYEEIRTIKGALNND